MGWGRALAAGKVGAGAAPRIPGGPPGPALREGCGELTGTPVPPRPHGRRPRLASFLQEESYSPCGPGQRVFHGGPGTAGSVGGRIPMCLCLNLGFSFSGVSGCFLGGPLFNAKPFGNLSGRVQNLCPGSVSVFKASLTRQYSLN